MAVAIDFTYQGHNQQPYLNFQLFHYPNSTMGTNYAHPLALPHNKNFHDYTPAWAGKTAMPHCCASTANTVIFFVTCK